MTIVSRTAAQARDGQVEGAAGRSNLLEGQHAQAADLRVEGASFRNVLQLQPISGSSHLAKAVDDVDWQSPHRLSHSCENYVALLHCATQTQLQRG